MPEAATGEFILKVVENRKALFSARFCIYLERLGKGGLELPSPTAIQGIA